MEIAIVIGGLLFCIMLGMTAYGLTHAWRCDDDDEYFGNDDL